MYVFTHIVLHTIIFLVSRAFRTKKRMRIQFQEYLLKFFVLLFFVYFSAVILLVFCVLIVVFLYFFFWGDIQVQFSIDINFLLSYHKHLFACLIQTSKSSMSEKKDKWNIAKLYSRLKLIKPNKLNRSGWLFFFYLSKIQEFYFIRQTKTFSISVFP